MANTVGVVSLGCAKNRIDTEQMLGLLRAGGWEITADPADADVIIVNTCGFIDPAKQESIDTILEMAEYKKTGRCRLLAATGCLVQRYSAALQEQMPEIDLLMGVSDYPHICELVDRALNGARPVACSTSREVFEAPRVLTTAPFSAFVRMGDGCDNRCAYCAIPLIRGGYRSRPYDHVLNEARGLVEAGVKEITYIAQDTTRFGDDLPKGNLASILRDTAALDGVHWVRTLYCYPSRVTDDLLDALAGNEKICAYLDLPLQHIDGRLLKLMHRFGTPDDIRSVIRRTRERGITLRTTMIVGFPTETEDDFQRMLDFVEETRFDRLGAFTYSAEEGTPAASMPGHVPEEVAQERLDRLMRLQQKISREINQARVGKTYEVLLERQEENGLWIGRSSEEAPEGDGCITLFTEQPHKAGEFVRARITGADAYDLTGEIL